MYKYSSSSSTTAEEQDQHAPLLTSSHNKNYSSILDEHSHSPEDCATTTTAVIEDDGLLFEQDNESIRRILERTRKRTSSTASSTTTSIFLHQQQQGKFTSTATLSAQNTTTTNNNNSKNPILSHSYWQSIFDRFSTSVYLENKGSVARDHLANERTYLAWLRTSLSTISVGIGITQLFRLERAMTHHPPQPPPVKHHTSFNGQMIGLLFIFISMLFLVFAFIRYFHAQVAMVNGYFPASRSTVAIASLILFFTMVLVLICVSKQ